MDYGFSGPSATDSRQVTLEFLGDGGRTSLMTERDASSALNRAWPPPSAEPADLIHERAFMRVLTYQRRQQRDELADRA
jgi:hypothetical protein